MAIGLGLLRLPPSHFWSMTPREFAAALGVGEGADAPDRTRLDALMARFPDNRKG